MAITSSEREPSPACLRFEGTAPYGPVPTADPAMSAGEIRQALAGRRFESAAHIAACAGPTLIGLVRIEDVLAADAGTTLGELMDTDPPVVTRGDDEEIAAWKAVRHGESGLALVDGDGRFAGIIPPRRLVEVLLAEHDEDLARLGGYLATASSARHATEEPVTARLWHRLPWLLLGLLGAIAAAAVVASFEEQLHRDVVLAFFVPGIVYLADAVGTQTEAVVIRGLSVGVPIHRVVGREALTGLVIGVVLAVVVFPLTLVLWGRADIAVAVSLALLAASSMASVVALGLPWLLHRSGRDPAFGSGPLATVIQDLLSLLVYFGVASVIVG